ncbi:MAG: RsbRD N-terminal domain-containing protein [Desulfobacterales bacterium]|nr:RsbRD N-terminal domain-containing protein [Desulfobacterales bacterium]MBF0396263.1 RsbRD N-terminal domain-containing protein [Desulfobacterales bacterium]
MKLKKLLSQKKSEIIQKWIDGILGTYPADTYQIFKKSGDQFANPVGTTLSREIAELTSIILEEEIDYNSVKKHLDTVIRIRAIQAFSPSQAIGFILLLKEIIKNILKAQDINLDELLLLYSQIDKLCLIGFDIYTECREKLFDIRVSEIKNKSFGALKRAGLVSEVLEDV